MSSGQEGHEVTLRTSTCFGWSSLLRFQILVKEGGQITCTSVGINWKVKVGMCKSVNVSDFWFWNLADRSPWYQRCGTPGTSKFGAKTSLFRGFCLGETQCHCNDHKIEQTFNLLSISPQKHPNVWCNCPLRMYFGTLLQVNSLILVVLLPFSWQHLPFVELVSGKLMPERNSEVNWHRFQVERHAKV